MDETSILFYLLLLVLVVYNPKHTHAPFQHGCGWYQTITRKLEKNQNL